MVEFDRASVLSWNLSLKKFFCYCFIFIVSYGFVWAAYVPLTSFDLILLHQMHLRIYSFLMVFSIFKHKFSKFSQMILWNSLQSVATSSFSSLIVLVWAFSFFWLVRIWLCQSCLFISKSRLWLILYIVHFVPILLISYPIYIISPHLPLLGLGYPCFPETFQLPGEIMCLRSQCFTKA